MNRGKYGGYTTPTKDYEPVGAGNSDLNGSSRLNGNGRPDVTCVKRTQKIIKKLTKKCNDRDLYRESDAHNRTGFYENCLNQTNHLEN